MTIDLNGVARLAGVTGAEARTSAGAPADASGFVTTVRRADEIPPFETVVQRAAAEGTGPTAKAGRPTAPNPPAASAPVIPKQAAKAKRTFEAFALQVFIGSMLPKENVRLFGTGSAGKMWQAMLAEKLADQIASSGRLKLLPDQPAGTAATPASALVANNAAPVPAGAAPADEARQAATASASAALETLAMGLKPGRGGGIR